MHITTPPAPPASAKALRRQFLAEGFRPGIPPGLSAEVLAVDLGVYRRQRCGLCRRRMKVKVYTDGTRHRLLCGCRHGCGFAVEG
jgi:hypothetical protein